MWSRWQPPNGEQERRNKEDKSLARRKLEKLIVLIIIIGVCSSSIRSSRSSRSSRSGVERAVWYDRTNNGMAASAVIAVISTQITTIH